MVPLGSVRGWTLYPLSLSATAHSTLLLMMMLLLLLLAALADTTHYLLAVASHTTPAS